ncbi:MAG: Nif3-like dinuclear metal center hexameric protein [Phycisphaeraceae bacterium]|nr:Nif3-like dinuclear metal center hexameric protein [Phycisphaeraceae bacterium]
MPTSGSKPRTIQQVIEALETIAPLQLAEPWDNTGLLLGDRGAGLLGPVFLTIDLTEASLAEAKQRGSGMIVAYHPTIFHELKRITADTPKGRTLLGALESGVPVYSPHTALDACEGGVTDWLCEMLATPGDQKSSHGDRRALQPSATPDPNAACKIVTFVPAKDAQRVRDGLASVGAGRIGAYSNCSFTIEGVGTFLGDAGTHPAVGQAGTLESVREARLEMVCPEAALPLAMEILRALHPYEEPACDVYPLIARPRRTLGAGRRIHFDQPMTPRQIAANLKANLGVDAVKLASAGEAPIATVGVCPGSGGSLIESAIADGCQLFVTGEVTHHEALAAVQRGCSILLAGHTNTEGGYLRRYAERIAALLEDTEVIVSATDGPIFRTY